VITRESDINQTVSNVTVDGNVISDHSPVMFRMPIAKPQPQSKTITFRRLKAIDPLAMRADIMNSDLVKHPSDNLTDLMDQYDTILGSILDKHAPTMTKKVVIRPDKQWYNDDIRNEKQIKRQLERKWRKTHNDSDKKAFQDQCIRVNEKVTATKETFFSEKIANCSDQKQMFSEINSLLHRNCDSPLPDHDSLEELVEKFSDYFVHKIQNIRSALEPSDPTQGLDPLILDGDIAVPQITSFEPTTEDEIRKIIAKSPEKSCSLDPIPTWILKQNADILAPVITKIVNLSLALGEVPKSMKLALITPLLKKILLDFQIFKNYRPVSNLTYASKITEKVVDARTAAHTKANNLDEPLQSAYKQGHSTETALLKVQNDILRAVDGKQVGILVLLDLSAAFDTVDHEVLLARLYSRFGISGTALQWYRSYLSDRYQQVCVHGVSSKPVLLTCGVPQGSVLGPQEFVKYSAPLSKIIQKYGLSYHFYADDTQIYVFFDLSDAETTTEKIEQCIAEIREWMKANFLKFNDDKTEVVSIGSKKQLQKLDPITLQIGDSTVQPTDSARNIGAFFDKHMKMEKQIIETCRVANFHIRNIRKIRNLLTPDTCKKLVQAFVTSRLDYANSLLIGLPDCQLKKLQRVQNNAARLIALAGRYDHVTPILKELHWLPISQRIVYKVLLITYKAVMGHAPIYIEELLERHESTRTLRSTGKLLLKVPRTKLKTYGDRAFSHAAPSLWNTLPLSIRSSESTDIFKTRQKTHLFCCAYT
jgi:hypothetical protein